MTMELSSGSLRATLGFFVAPLMAAVLCAVTRHLSPGFNGMASGLIPVFYFVAFMASGVLGFPAFLLLHRIGWVRWWSASLTGAVIGAVVATGLALPSAPAPTFVLIFAAIGTCAALCFWAIWRCGALSDSIPPESPRASASCESERTLTSEREERK